MRALPAVPVTVTAEIAGGGREQALLDLAADLEIAGSSAVGQDRLLSGLGGVGKTRLAVEYAWRYGSRYTAVRFVRADSRAGLRRGLAALQDLLPGAGPGEAVEGHGGFAVFRQAAAPESWC